MQRFILIILLFFNSLWSFSQIDLSSWALVEERHFSPENLWDYINGAAEGYLVYEFENLTVKEYEHDLYGSLKVELYRHSSVPMAFGIYSLERPAEGADYLEDIGTLAYASEGVLNILVDRYYVKLLCYSEEEGVPAVLEAFAKVVADSIGGASDLPKILSYFPEKCKVPNTDGFISTNFMGFSCLSEVFVVNYIDDSDQSEYQLFVIESSDDKAVKKILKCLRKQSNGRPKLTEDQYLSFETDYNQFGLLWSGRYLLGIKSDFPTDRQAALLDSFWSSFD